MKIGVYVTGQGPHIDIIEHLLESVKQHMPEVPVFHLTDTETACIPGTEAIRLPKGPLAVQRCAFYAQLLGDWCFVDTDVVFRKDVRHVFEKDFDVAFCQRHETNDYATVMPYNLGVVFSRNTMFWQDIHQAIKDLPPKLQEWDGLQLAAGWYATRNWCPHKIEVLPASYNYAPDTADEDLSDKAIIHYKGKRKRFLPSKQVMSRNGEPQSQPVHQV